MENNLPVIQPDKGDMDEMNKNIVEISPKLDRIISLLKKNGMREFEIMVDSGDTIKWNDARIITKTPTQDLLAFDLTVMLDHYYPNNTRLVMGMMWSDNRIVAEQIARIVAEYRKRDRAQVESQIIALLQAFKQSN